MGTDGTGMSNIGRGGREGDGEEEYQRRKKRLLGPQG
jgi:hypothetical protein